MIKRLINRNINNFNYDNRARELNSALITGLPVQGFTPAPNFPLSSLWKHFSNNLGNQRNAWETNNANLSCSNVVSHNNNNNNNNKNIFFEVDFFARPFFKNASQRKAMEAAPRQQMLK